MEITAASQSSSAGGQNPQKILRAAHEFEALLLANALGGLEHAFTQISGDTPMAGSEAYQSLGMQAVATVIANHGGIGIGDMVARSLARTKSHNP
jgi:Rod binding domain-containing protein